MATYINGKSIIYNQLFATIVWKLKMTILIANTRFSTSDNGYT
jgi:hypothetical protein